MTLASTIRARAAEVRRHGTYLGFFEWMMWAVLERTPVYMVFGENIVDVTNVFGGRNTFDFPKAHKPVYPVACQVDSKGSLWCARYDSAGMFHANRYVFGIPIRAHGPVRGLGTLRAEHDKRPLATVCMSAGFGFKTTVTDGDCAPDCMATRTFGVSSIENFTSLRHRIADLMERVAEDNAGELDFVRRN